MPWRIDINEAWLRLGKVRGSGTYGDMSNPAVVDAKEFALIFAWAKNWEFLTVQATASNSAGALQEGIDFEIGINQLRSVIQAIGRPESLEELFDRKHLEERHFLSAKIERGQEVTVDVEIDTDDKRFVEIVQRRFNKRKERAEQEGKQIRDEDIAAQTLFQVPMLYLDDDDDEGQFVHILLKETRAPEFFRGFAALDLGNTNSTLTCLTAGKSESRHVRVLPDVRYEEARQKQLSSIADSIESRMEIKAVNVTGHDQEQQEQSMPEASGQPTDFDWVIGRHTPDRGSYAEGIVIAPKRLLTRRAGIQGGSKLDIGVRSISGRTSRGGGNMVQLSYRIPTELFVCRMFQNFQAVVKRRLEKVALTYPTSYSRWELEQLRKTVWGALRRSQWRGHENLSEESKIKDFIALELDEASAAAFYFLHKKIFELPGALHRFRYLHPQGYNLLLYDCGGGTTDISLVHAKATAHDTLRVEVLGRSGLRDFGGDNITVAVFHILKAKLAHRLQQKEPTKVGSSLRKLDKLPSERSVPSDEWHNYLQQNDDLIETIVPTTFDPTSQQFNHKRQQQNAFFLWGWAETIKRRFSDNEPLSKGGYQSGGAQLDKLAQGIGVTKEIIEEVMSQISVRMDEVDSLIRDKVNHSVQRCNSLIESRLMSDDRSGHRGEQVDSVCVVGNSSRYPLVQKCLKEQLNVVFLGGDESQEENVPKYERRYVFVEDDLKHAVAKGATLALARDRAAERIKLDFPSRLSEQLPYDVGYVNAASGAYVPLFHEGMFYEEIEDVLVPLFESEEAGTQEMGEQQNWFYLRHRWPGEDHAEFLQFHFPDGIGREVRISYDKDEHEFVINGILGERDISKAIYNAPEQRGDLRFNQRDD